MNEQPRVVVFDDHRFVATAVVSMLAESGVPAAAACTLDELRAILAEHTPEVVLCDLSLPDADGFSVATDLARRTRVVVLSADARPESVHRALTAGAQGYLSKLLEADDLRAAVLTALEGKPVLDTESLRRLLQHLQQATAHPELTARENEVAALLLEGCTNQEMADRLYLGVETVRTHLKNLYEKLGCSSRPQALDMLRRSRDGLFPPS